ncbi:MAG: hypothetical protein U5M50_05420 [Sphingobium sp.]|nr:hypothetical protein [Sphingobium sp.]
MIWLWVMLCGGADDRRHVLASGKLPAAGAAELAGRGYWCWGCAGYALQGSPALPGKPVAAPRRARKGLAMRSPTGSEQVDRHAVSGGAMAGHVGRLCAHRQDRTRGADAGTGT